MGTNEGWPEAFGFTAIGDAPVMIGDVEEGGSAQQAGLQMGDFIMEINGESVDRWSREEVVQFARQSQKVPPSLVVMSRMRKFSLKKKEDGGFGITFRGNRPVFVRSVDFDSHAHSSGLKSGDLLVQFNGKNVRYSTKIEVLELLKSASDPLHLTVVAGGLGPANLGQLEAAGRGQSRPAGGRPFEQQTQVSQQRIELRYEKARVFRGKMDYYLMGNSLKKTQLLTLLRLYTKNRDIKSLGSALNILLDTPIEKRLLADIRTFIHPSHYDLFDVLVSFDPRRPLQSSNLAGSGQWRGSLMWTRPLGAGGDRSSMRASLPDLSATAPMGRAVKVSRGHGEFGFTLSGNAPVYVRSVDRGGAAERAGLQPGDQIMQINGVYVRGATHSQVVHLLRSSGPHPMFVVCSSLEALSPPLHQSSPRGPQPPPSSSSSSSTTSDASGDMRANVQTFKDKMKEVLSESERQDVMKQLSKFSQHKEVPELVNSLSWVLDSPAKIVLFHHICQLLPDKVQGDFDRIAAAMLAGVPAVNLSGGAEPLDGEVMIGGHGPGSRLSSSSSGSSYSTAGGIAAGGRGAAAAGGGRGQGGGGRGTGASAGSGGDELEETPVKLPKSPERKSMPPKATSTPVLSPSSRPPFQLLPDVSTMSTPGGVPLPPNPPPTPAGGVGGVPVPPPPPPALSQQQQQQAHLKRVNWEKLHGTEGTIWKELSGLEDTLEYCELEEKFASQKAKEAGAKKNQKPAILDQRKAYNISILLGHLKLPFNKIREAVIGCDDSVLSEQHLRQMEAFAPDKKECLGFTRFLDNRSALSIADKFSCEMSTIPGYQQRLRAMIFKLHFKEKIEEIKPDLEAISKASRQLQTSKNFKRVLEIVLAVGNYMNAGNYRVGGAVGFKIKFLTELKNLKTTDNKSTLLHFVAGTVERKFPQVLEFAEDLNFTMAAARVSGETLEVEVNELTKGLQDIQRDIEEFSLADERPPGDRFIEVMTDFVSHADQEMTALLKLYAHMKQEYASVLKFFGEEPSTMRIDDFFSTFAAFIAEFERAVRENQETREKAALLERKKEEKEKAAKRRGSFGKFFSRSSKSFEEQDTKKELEAKVKAVRRIDVKALEESRKEKAKQSLDKEQKDFRHVLRPTSQSKAKKTAPQQRQSPVEMPQAMGKADGHRGGGDSSSGGGGGGGIRPADVAVTRASEKKRSKKFVSGSPELTGSWDYIPSEPTSTVDLTAENTGDGRRTVMAAVHNANATDAVPPSSSRQKVAATAGPQHKKVLTQSNVAARHHAVPTATTTTAAATEATRATTAAYRQLEHAEQYLREQLNELSSSSSPPSSPPSQFTGGGGGGGGGGGVGGGGQYAYYQDLPGDSDDDIDDGAWSRNEGLGLRAQDRNTPIQDSYDYETQF